MDQEVSGGVETLTPCPFCGGDAHIGTVRHSRPLKDTEWEDGSPITEAFFGHCSRCSATHYNFIAGGYQTERQAIAAWNRREEPDEIERLRAENADLRQSVIAFCGPWAGQWAKLHGLPPGHLHPTHYDILAKAGARMDEFTRHKETQGE